MLNSPLLVEYTAIIFLIQPRFRGRGKEVRVHFFAIEEAQIE